MTQLIGAMARDHAVRCAIAPYIFSIDVGVRSSLAGRIARCIGQSLRGRPPCWPNSPLRPQTYPTQCLGFNGYYLAIFPDINWNVV